ncbi:GNAT family N-acetyltransferase [Allofustis seminis]|uniref:GNAT family N-acetyltransferase n=1 Tax=Allofustis seminis TaxID=166939 RepID=UPI00035F1107|nr:hypothetical protein [Allofustis seminis]
MYHIRKAVAADLPRVKQLIQNGRKRQIASGNIHQWQRGYPSDELLQNDFDRGTIYLCLECAQIVGTFTLFQMPDPTYATISNGNWLNDAPYVTIHRIATAESAPGAGQFCLSFVQRHFDNIRIDTHEDNHVMRHILAKLGFQEVGIIQLADGSDRLAFHYAK